MTPRIGAKIEGVNLREELSDQVVEESGDAWPKHQVIFSRPGTSHEQHLAFAARFGALHTHHRQHAEVSVVHANENSRYVESDVG